MNFNCSSKSLLIGLFLLFFVFGCISDSSNTYPYKINQNTNESAFSNVSANPNTLSSNNTVQILFEECKNKPLLESVMCVSDLAIRFEDMSICYNVLANDSVQQTLNSDFCVAKFAFHKSDVFLCSKIKTRSLKNACFMDLADVLNDSNICEKLDSDEIKFNCYMAMAISRNDSSTCKQISNNDFSLICLARLNDDVSYCQNVSVKSYQDECYLYVIYKTHVLSDCYNINDDMSHDACVSIIASYTLNSSICDNVRLAKNLQNCKDTVNSNVLFNIND
jgi:hypothetical protein